MLHSFFGTLVLIFCFALALGSSEVLADRYEDLINAEADTLTEDNTGDATISGEALDSEAEAKKQEELTAQTQAFEALLEQERKSTYKVFKKLPTDRQRFVIENHYATGEDLKATSHTIFQIYFKEYKRN